MHTTNGIIRVNIINKGIKYKCSFFVVPGQGSALLGMADYEQQQLPSMNCQSTNDQYNGRQINEQTKQGKSKVCNSLKISTTVQPSRHTNVECNERIRQEGDRIKECKRRTNTERGNFYNGKIRIDRQETRETLLLWGHSNINHVDIFTSMHCTTYHHARERCQYVTVEGK